MTKYFRAETTKDDAFWGAAETISGAMASAARRCANAVKERNYEKFKVNGSKAHHLLEELASAGRAWAESLDRDDDFGPPLALADQQTQDVVDETNGGADDLPKEILDGLRELNRKAHELGWALDIGSVVHASPEGIVGRGYL